jgi:hypothetical protein
MNQLDGNMIFIKRVLTMDKLFNYYEQENQWELKTEVLKAILYIHFPNEFSFRNEHCGVLANV